MLMIHKNNEIIDYYKSLGLSDAQSTTLSLLTYGYDYNLRSIIEAYNKSKYKHDNISFCELVYKIYTENKGAENILDILEKELGIERQVNIKGNSCISFSNFCMALNEDYYEDEDYDGPDILDDITELCEDISEDSICSLDVISINSFSKTNKNVIKPINFVHYLGDESEKTKKAKKAMINPTSTFRATTSRVSMDFLLADMLNIGYDKCEILDRIRLEEIINYPNYNLDIPSNTDSKFKITTELMDNGDNKKVMFIGIQAKKVIPKKQNIVILLDSSGSMNNSLVETQLAIITIVSKLNIGDKLSIIAYSDNDTVVIDNITINNKSMDFIIERLFEIYVSGCTNGSGGLHSAYELIEKNKIEDGINRVVLITDGDFNFSTGTKSSIINIEKEVADIVLKHRNNGSYMSVIGCGYIINDNIMSTVARNGNGNYCAITNLETVDRNINKSYESLMYPIAKDVKVQVEFNQALIESYKLIGYDTRELNHEDFKDDNIIAEPFGSGEQAVAIYELQMNIDKENKSPFKYLDSCINNTSEICTVSLRYKDIEDDAINQIDKVVYNEKSDNTYNCEKAYELYKLVTNKNSDRLIKLLEKDL